MDGREVDREQPVRSVARTLSTVTDWREICRVMCEEAEIVLSNMGGVGYRPAAADEADKVPQDMSYAAKLMHLPMARFERNRSPHQVMPLELVMDNGAVLRKRVLELASGRAQAFQDWLEHE